MGLPPVQHPAPPATNLPPPPTYMPPPQTFAPPKATQLMHKDPQPDVFLDKLHGPSITLLVGPKLQYTLPIALLCTHSLFFRDEVMRLIHARNRKRKFGSEESGTGKGEGELKLDMKDTDPLIFGLFLKFIYTGGYPESADAQACAIVAADGQQGSGGIPPSVRAWLLAQRLRSTSFMNHAIAHVYHGIGRHFALTPEMVDYVWIRTAVPVAVTRDKVDESTPPIPIKVDNTDVATPPPTPTKVDDVDVPVADNSLTVLFPSPLRALVLSVLTTYWTGPSPQLIAHHPQAAWNTVFDAHPDLRRGFIFGLQGSRKMLAVQGYFAKQGAKVVAVKEEDSGEGKVV